jgi:hypothetical protein
VTKSRKPPSYTQRRGNVFQLRPTPPRVAEPSEEVKAQILEFTKHGSKAFRLDAEGNVQPIDVTAPISLYVAADGPRAARWLIRTHRAGFHRSGYVDFLIPVGTPVPRWFQVAFMYLENNKQLRSKPIVKRPNFEAEMVVRHGVCHYKVMWSKWNKFSIKARARSLIAPPANEVR